MVEKISIYNYMSSGTTLDSKHREMIEKFREKRESLPELKKILESVKRELEECSNIPNNKKNYELIYELEIKIKQMEEEIISIENETNEIDYISKTSNLLFQYYSNNFNKKAKPNVGILQYFTKKNSSVKTPDINPIINKISKNMGKGDLSCLYLQKISDDYIVQEDKNEAQCNKCGKEMLLEQEYGYYVCPNCSEMVYVSIDSDKPSYKDPPPESSYFPYKKINRFNEWLNQIQARETTEIPDIVFDKIRLEIKKEMIKDLTKIDRDRIKLYLKKYKFNKYYDHIPFIIFKLNGVSPPKLSPEQETTLKCMFSQMLGPFMEVKPENRKNAPSYSYLLYKFVELLGWDHLKKCFSLLKSRKRLYQQDKIWEAICSKLKWEFIASI